jgi:hypothetical protein
MRALFPFFARPRNDRGAVPFQVVINYYGNGSSGMVPWSPCLEYSPTIPLSRPTHERMIAALASRPPEAGGLLLGPSNHRLVTHFLFDERGRVTPTTWTPDRDWLNASLKPFLGCGIDVKGFCHSHPSGFARPSSGDRDYLLRTLENPRNAAAEIFFPIFCDGVLHPYVVTPKSLRLESDWAVPARIQIL